RGGPAGGPLCHSARAPAGNELGELAAVTEASRAELAVVHLPRSLWVPALDQPELASIGGCLLVSLPGERSLAALAVGELGRRGLPARVVTRAPSPLGARRALARARAGGRLSPGAGRAASRLLGLGPKTAERPLRAQRRQALPALLAAALLLIPAPL